jgi:hypothetical protein
MLKIGLWKLLLEGFNFHVPFQLGEDDRQPDMAATTAQITTQPKHAFLIDSVLAPKGYAALSQLLQLQPKFRVENGLRKNRMQVDSDANESTEAHYHDSPPELSRLFGATT